MEKEIIKNLAEGLVWNFKYDEYFGNKTSLLDNLECAIIYSISKYMVEKTKLTSDFVLNNVNEYYKNKHDIEIGLNKHKILMKELCKEIVEYSFRQGKFRYYETLKSWNDYH